MSLMTGSPLKNVLTTTTRFYTFPWPCRFAAGKTALHLLKKEYSAGHTFYKAGMIGEEKAFPAAFACSQEQNCVEVHQWWGYHGPR